MKRNWVVLVGLFVTLHVAIWFMYRRRSDPQPPSAPAHTPTTGGQSQANRVDDFVAQTEAYTTFDTCALGLGDAIQADFDVVFDAKFQSQDAIPQMSFAQVLADRRAAKLYGFLMEMPKDEAARKAVELFHEKLDFHRNEMEFGLNGWKTNGKAERPVALYRNHHATLCALFLCSNFCDGRDVLKLVDQWESDIRPLLDSLARDSRTEREPAWAGLKQETTMYGCPERLFLANLYCHILCVRGHLEMSEIPPAIGWKYIPESTPTPFCRWDAMVTSFDFVQVHQGAAVDLTGKLVTVNLMRGWSSMSGLDDFQVKFLEEVRRVITERKL